MFSITKSSACIPSEPYREYYYCTVISPGCEASRHEGGGGGGGRPEVWGAGQGAGRGTSPSLASSGRPNKGSSNLLPRDCNLRVVDASVVSTVNRRRVCQVRVKATVVCWWAATRPARRGLLLPPTVEERWAFSLCTFESVLISYQNRRRT